jgi:16S rRNA (guanine1516-N2)-methyltransferase
MNANQQIAIKCESTDPSRRQYAKKLARELMLEQVANDNNDFPLFLIITPERIELRQKKSSLAVDFLSPELNYRRLHGGGRKQAIAKAVGIKPGVKPRIIDATAGLGIDGFILACLGCELQMIERSPILAALLADGMKRYEQQCEEKLNWRLIKADALNYLNQLISGNYPDVIYLDPMFPPGNKSALSKKSMQLLQQLIVDTDADKLLEIALKRARKRVVVKRPRLAIPLANKQPDLCLTGKSSRFDIYLCGF